MSFNYTKLEIGQFYNKTSYSYEKVYFRYDGCYGGWHKGTVYYTNVDYYYRRGIEFYNHSGTHSEVLPMTAEQLDDLYIKAAEKFI